MNVLSLFDGMSCGRMALERANIQVDKYYASEIDKYATQVSEKNYPDIIRLGDVTKWKEWDIDWGSIDLLLAGSPCQGFSFAGKQLAFDDPRSKLFFVFVDILNHIKKLNPNVKFLLENVRMKKEYLDVISKQVGVEPVMINSALVSAQNRKRYYWSNVGEVLQPNDKKTLLKDVLEETVSTSYAILGGHLQWWMKNKDFQLKKKYSSLDSDIAITLTARQYASWNGNFITSERMADIGNGGQGERLYSMHGKNVSLSALGGGRGAKTGLCLDKNLVVRKLTPVECERLQTVPDNYTDCVSNTQRYKMLGNGWTVDVIAHIFKNLSTPTTNNQER